MRDRLTRQKAFAALLLAISILSLTPTLAHADQQAPSHPVTITATGQGTAIGTGPSGAAALNLTANAYENADKWLLLQNTTGSITIGSASYPITGGQGSVNQFGYVMIFADADSEKDNLILHGTMNGTSLSFTPPSQLVSTAYLALSGTVTQGTDPTLSAITSSSEDNAFVTSTMNRTQESNSASISTTSLSISQNVTGTSSEMISTSTSTPPAQTVGTNAAATSTENSNGGAAVIPQASGNVTVTVTQYLSRTSSTTQTVANTTISYTVTTTVANTTITEANATTTHTATTGT